VVCSSGGICAEVVGHDIDGDDVQVSWLSRDRLHYKRDISNSRSRTDKSQNDFISS